MTTPAVDRGAAPVAALARVRVARPTRRLAPALGAWAALCAVACTWGVALLHAGVHMQIGSPPLTGRSEWRPSLALVAVAAVGLVAAVVLPAASARLPWHGLLAVAPLAAVAWGVAINAADGWSALTSPVHNEYAATAAAIVSPAKFLGSFVDHIGRYNLHTRAHPPGMELVLWCLRPVGVRSSATVAAALASRLSWRPTDGRYGSPPPPAASARSASLSSNSTCSGRPSA